MNGRQNGRIDEPATRDDRAALTPVAEILRAAGFYAYTAIDAESRWTVACDTDEGHVDVRVGDDGLDLEVWDTSPGLFWEEEDERRRAARERLARVTLPALARGHLAPNQEIWWDEADHGIGARLRVQVPFALQGRLGAIARQHLAELNDLIAFVEAKLFE